MRASGRRRWGRQAAALLLAVASTRLAAAGTIEVNAGAAYGPGGDGFGAEITLVDTCISPDDRTVDAPAQIQGFFGACDDLVVQGVEVVGAGTIFQAGQSIALGDGFGVAAGAELTAILATPLSPFAYVTDDTPAAATLYSAEYRLDLAGLTIGAGDTIASLVGLAQDGVEHFRIVLSHHAGTGEDRVRVCAREDDGGLLDGQELLLPPGYNLIELRWAAGAGSGSLLLAINGSVFTGLTGLDNDQARIDRVRWGAVDGVVEASSGSLAQDEFASGL